MNSSRQLLLGVAVFLGGGVLLYAMVQQIDAPEVTALSNNTSEIAGKSITQGTQITDNSDEPPLTADINTETQILAQKRREREAKMAELDEQTRKFLAEQEEAEMLAMEKARLENQRYQDNSIEPVMDEAIVDSESSESARSNIVTKPVVVPRVAESKPPTPNQSTQAQSTQAQSAQSQSAQSQSIDNKTAETKLAHAIAKREESQSTDTASPAAATAQRAPSNAQDYTVQRGDGLIKLSRRYNIPLEALLQANKLSKNATLAVGQKLTIPAGSQVDRLVRDYQSGQSSQSTQPNQAQATTNTQAATNQNTAPKPENNEAPTRQLNYEVGHGDGLIKLARQYNVPVEALAQANNLSTNATLRVGQTLTIPSRRQVARLQREAEQKQKEAQAKREAQQRLAEARRKAASGEAKGTFGVQVALANNQEKADEIVKRMQAAGYPASTSATSRGVRVIVGPEKGKEAALALKDKIDADSRVNVDGAWVLYWR